MPWQPRAKFTEWPDDANDLEPDRIIALYEMGFAGCKHDPNAIADFQATMSDPDGDAAAHKYGLADSGAGKLVIPFVHVLEMFPGCWPGPAQRRGDCVSWGTKNAALLTMACDVVSGLPDPRTGLPEQAPDVPAAGIPEGVLSTEAIYWYRRHGGDGWMCHAAATVAVKESCLWVRKDYPEIGVDLTQYSASLAGKYGRNTPPSNITSMGQKHLAHQATECNSFESIRDMLANGYGILDCGGEGYESTRDECGVSRRRGSWAHSMCKPGADDRDIIKQKYGEPLCLIGNSHGEWNRGPRDIYQSASLVPAHKKQLWIAKGIVNPDTGNIMIPHGFFWTPWSQCKNRESIALAGVNGWVKREIDHFI